MDRTLTQHASWNTSAAYRPQGRPLGLQFLFLTVDCKWEKATHKAAVDRWKLVPGLMFQERKTLRAEAKLQRPDLDALFKAERPPRADELDGGEPPLLCGLR